MRGLAARLAAITKLLIGIRGLGPLEDDHIQAALAVSSNILTPKEAHFAYGLTSLHSEQTDNG